jgi:hypothetical protein
MEEKFNIIKSLQKDINILQNKIEKNKQTIDTDKLIILNQLLDIFDKNKINIIDDLFDGKLNINEDETIKRLTSLKNILQIILEIEQNIKENKSTTNMKRKELYNYIREEIISELTNENIAVELTGATGTTVQSFINKSAADKFKSQNPNIKAIKPLEEDELEEARKANNLKVDNQEKFTAAKNLYANSWIGELLNAVEEAGEEGISIKSLTEKVGKKASANINPLIQELKSIGAIASTRITGEPEVVEPEVEEPETTTPESDFFITDTDDKDKEEEEKEPTDSDEDEDNKAYKGAKKVDDKETKKSDEKIIKKNKNKELVDTIIGKIKKLKGDEKAKKIAALKSFINNKDNGFSTSERDAILKRL